MASCDWPVRDRGGISPGSTLAGPLIVESADTTIVVPAGCSARADESGNLIIRIPEDGLTDPRPNAAERENAQCQSI
jgi:hypothetical protein